MAEPKRYRNGWRVQLKINGKPVAFLGRTKKEAAQKAAEAQIKLGKGLSIAAKQDTFGQWRERWEAIKAPSVSSGRMEAYRSAAKNYLSDLDPMPIDKIRLADVQLIFSGLKLSASRLGDIRTVCNGVFALAVRNRIIDYNPMPDVIMPKHKEKETERDALTEEEREQVEALEHRGRLPAMVMMYAGLRPEEVIPLLWTDVDLKNDVIKINKTVERQGSQYIQKNSGKTQAAMRKVPIPEKLAVFLRQEKKKATTLLLCPDRKGQMMSVIGWRRLWESWLNTFNYVFGDFSGCKDVPHDANGRPVQKRFAPGKLPLVVRRITPYWFRHTYCTMLYQAGVDVKTTMEWMGHTRIETTLGIYTHLDKNKRKSTEKLDQMLSQKGSTKVVQGG